MDYSENMAQMHKYEVQSAHFNNRNYSLHCTVEHTDHDKNQNLWSPYLYHYHFSEEMKHDSAFTTTVIDCCINNDNLPEFIRNKKDNCAVQYKSGYTFNEFCNVAKKYNRNILKYYGPSGHGKGLVDTMSAFGIKTPLLKSVITDNFRYNSSQDMCDMLQSTFKNDNQKKYSVIDVEDILLHRSKASAIPIKGSRSYHMMCFRPDGSILCKVNLCLCTDCILGNFLDCVIEPGKIFSAEEGEDDDVDSDVEYEDDVFGDEIDDMNGKYELRSNNVLEVISVNDVIALFSSSESIELFYLCKVLSFGIVEQDLKDENNHCIEKGGPYIEVKYFKLNQTTSRGLPLYINACQNQYLYIQPKSCHLKLI